MISKKAIPLSGDFTHWEPARLFDNCYYVGTKSVGALVIDSGNGIIMIDAGWGDRDCALMVEDMKKLGLNPHNIKYILISHEHLDHFGGVPYLKREVCPNAMVGLSAVGWYHLQARPASPPGGPYGNTLQSVDMFLADGQKISLGNTVIQIVFTPGHSPGCVSFIIPVTDNGNRHTLGIIGGTGLINPGWEKAYLYKSSISYFQKFASEAQCDAGFSLHAWDYEEDMAFLRSRKPGEPNPLVIGTAKFDPIYLQKFRDIFQEAANQMPPEILPTPPPWAR